MLTLNTFVTFFTLKNLISTTHTFTEAVAFNICRLPSAGQNGTCSGERHHSLDRVQYNEMCCMDRDVIKSFDLNITFIKSTDVEQSDYAM